MSRPSYTQSVVNDRPRTVYFYATHECNSNCSYCVFRYSNKNMARIHMPLSTVERVWDESEILRECGVVVQGGEITTHPQALDIMKFFCQIELPKITLLTNAVEPEDSLPLVQYCNQVTVSLDGPKHDLARGVKGNLDNIIWFFTKLNKSGLKRKKTLQMTIGPWNAPTQEMAIDNVKWFLDMCLEFGAQPRFNIASDDGLLGTAHYDQKIGILTRIFGDMIDLANMKKYSELKGSILGGSNYIMTAVLKMGGKKMACYSTSIYSTIGADGKVWMCQGLNEEEAVIGNVNEIPFDEIWANSGEKRIDYRLCQKCVLSCQLTGDIAFGREYSL